MKKFVATFALFAMLLGSSANKLEGVEFSSSIGGCGYEDAVRAPVIAPAVALGTLALAAIIAVALINSNSVHGHAHD